MKIIELHLRIMTIMKILKLNSKISKKKAELQPIIKELKQLREEIDDMSGEHEARKNKYDQINAGFESNRSQLEAVSLRNFFVYVYCLLHYLPIL